MDLNPSLLRPMCNKITWVIYTLNRIICLQKNAEKRKPIVQSGPIDISDSALEKIQNCVPKQFINVRELQAPYYVIM